MDYNQAQQLLNHALQSQETIQIEKLKIILEVLDREKTVEILKSKNGVPSVIHYQGNRYIRDMQNKLNTHKYRAK